MKLLATSGTGYRLPVGTAVAHAYRTVIDNARLAVDLAWLPFAVATAVSIIFILVKALAGGGTFGRVVTWLAAIIVYIAFRAIFAVRWYRFALLGEKTPGPLFTPEWRAYLGVVVKVGVLIIVSWLALGVIAMLIRTLGLSSLGVLIFALGAIAALFAAPVWVLLAFPAAAVGAPLPLLTACDLLGGNFWRLFAAFVLCVLPFSIGVFVLERLGEAALFPIEFLCDAMGGALNFAGTAVSATLVSETYRRLAGPAPGGIASTAA